MLKNMIKELQTSNLKMSKQIDELKNNQKELITSDIQTENNMLKTKVSNHEKDITNFGKSTKTFENILSSQKCIFDKGGIGFESNKKRKLYKDFFIPQEKPKQFKCNLCHKNGHLELFCHKKIHIRNSPFRKSLTKALTFKDPKQYGYLKTY
jgi:hypothetical protein